MYALLAHETNYSQALRKESDIQYIVIHYTANNGDTARNNLSYYHATANVKASAHFYVDEKEVCVSVPWYNVAWHCGGNRYPNTLGGAFWGKCRNSNSIGIEMCSRKDNQGRYYFKDEVVQRAAEFTAKQMKLYKIPIERVIRHYDVVGKICPAPFVNDEIAWEEFKELVMQYYSGGEIVKYYENVTEIPDGELRNTVQKWVDAGIIKGTGNGIHLTEDMVRMIVFLERRFGQAN